MKSPNQHRGLHAALRERQRYAASVLQKIDETYPILSQGKITLSPEAVQVVYPAVEVELENKEKWMDTRDNAIARSPNSEAISLDKVNEAAWGIILRYVEGFYLREQLLRQQVERSSRFYDLDGAKRKLLDAYLNHQCNVAELQLQSLGLSAVSAHACNGSLIRASMIAFREYNPDVEMSYLSPGIGSIRGKHQTVDERIGAIRDYWHIKKHELGEAHRRFSQNTTACQR